jgi:hypothetical protein
MPANVSASADQQFIEQCQLATGASTYREQAPSLAPWGILASRVAKIIKYHPALAARLLCAPRAAFHVAAIYLLQNVYKDIPCVADELLHLSPGELLIHCFEPGHRYMAALSRCPPKVQSLQFYLKLNQLLWSPLADDILSESRITVQLLSFIADIQQLDPLVWHARHALRLEPTNAKQFDSMLKFCRRLGVLREDEFESRVLRNAAKVGVGRYITRRLSRCVSPWSFDLPAPLTHIKTAKRLIEIASKHGNCLGRVSYRVQLGLGSHIYIMVGDDCVVELRHEYAGLWSIVECERLTENCSVSHEERAEICGMLRQAGLNAQTADFAGLWMDIEHFRSNQPLDLFGD